jgi:chromosome segregation ATPase
MDRVRNRDLLTRIDAHMERGNELTELVRQELTLIRQEFRENRGAVYAARDAIREVAGSVQRQSDVLERQGRRLEEMQGEIKDLRAESQAHTQAIFRVLDRFDGRGGPGPA